jgi:hypothetical protein
MADVTFGDSNNERLARLVVLRKEAADALRLPGDHYRVRQLAAYHLNHETLLARLIDGDNTVTDRIATVAAAIDAMTPELPPEKIKLEILPSGPATCPRCGWQKPDEGVVVNPNGEGMLDGLRDFTRTNGRDVLVDAPDVLTDSEPGSDAPPAPENASAATTASAKQDPQKAEEKAVEQMPYHERMLRRAPGSADLHHMVPGKETGSNPYGVGPRQTGQVSQPQRVAPEQSPVVWFGSRKDLYK